MSKRVVTCGCAVVHLDHEPGEPTIFDKGYEIIRHPFSSKPSINKVSRNTSKQSRYSLRHSHA